MSAQILELPIRTARQVALIFNEIAEDLFHQAAIIVAIFQNLPADTQAAVVEKLNRLHNDEVTKHE